MARTTAKYGIGWTQLTSNAVIGCSRKSEGCRHCYAELLAATRLRNQPRYKGLAVMKSNGEPQWTGQTRIIKPELEKLLLLKKSHRIFLTSMGDPFHESLLTEQIDLLFAYMQASPRQNFQLLTKRPERMLAYLTDPEVQARVRIFCEQIAKEHGWQEGRANEEAIWPLRNVWLGTSVEDQPTADERILLLLQCPAALRWVSAEPLLELVEFTMLNGSAPFDSEGAQFYNALSGISYWDNGDFGCRGPKLDWIVTGGESGRRSRCPHPEWFRSIRDQCQTYATPFFFKQWGTWTQVQTPHKTDILCRFPLPRMIYPQPVVRSLVTDLTHQLQGNEVFMRKIPKKKAGNQLDGQVWNQLPMNPNPHFQEVA